MIIILCIGILSNLFYGKLDFQEPVNFNNRVNAISIKDLETKIEERNSILLPENITLSSEEFLQISNKLKGQTSFYQNIDESIKTYCSHIYKEQIQEDNGIIFKFFLKGYRHFLRRQCKDKQWSILKKNYSSKTIRQLRTKTVLFHQRKGTVIINQHSMNLSLNAILDGEGEEIYLLYFTLDYQKRDLSIRSKLAYPNKKKAAKTILNTIIPSGEIDSKGIDIIKKNRLFLIPFAKMLTIHYRFTKIESLDEWLKNKSCQFMGKNICKLSLSNKLYNELKGKPFYDYSGSVMFWNKEHEDNDKKSNLRLLYYFNYNAVTGVLKQRYIYSLQIELGLIKRFFSRKK